MVEGKTWRLPQSLQENPDPEKKEVRKIPLKSFTLRPIYPEFQYLYDRELKGRKNQKSFEFAKQAGTAVTILVFFSDFLKQPVPEATKFEQVGLKDEESEDASDKEESSAEEPIPQFAQVSSISSLPSLEFALSNMALDDPSKRPEETTYDDLCRSYFVCFILNLVS